MQLGSQAMIGLPSLAQALIAEERCAGVAGGLVEHAV